MMMMTLSVSVFAPPPPAFGVSDLCFLFCLLLFLGMEDDGDQAYLLQPQHTLPLPRLIDNARC